MQQGGLSSFLNISKIFLFCFCFLFFFNQAQDLRNSDEYKPWFLKAVVSLPYTYNEMVLENENGPTVDAGCWWLTFESQLEIGASVGQQRASRKASVQLGMNSLQLFPFN